MSEMPRQEQQFLGHDNPIPSKEKRKTYKELQYTFETRIEEHTKEFLSLKDKIASDEKTALKRERETLHPDTITQAREHLQSAYIINLIIINLRQDKSNNEL